MRLAKELGCSLRECKERISYDEFLRWIAYAEIEPFGEVRQDYRFGKLLSVLWNLIHAAMGKKENKQPQDFFPTLKTGQNSFDKFLNSPSGQRALAHSIYLSTTGGKQNHVR